MNSDKKLKKDSENNKADFKNENDTKVENIEVLSPIETVNLETNELEKNKEIVIEVNNLTKSYGKNRGIVDVSLKVGKGEVFGFIGPNGAGKSTLIRTLLGLQKQTSGNAKLLGIDIAKFSEEIAENVGYLPSEVFYYDNMKVKELLNYSASFYKKDCSKRIKELAKRLDLELNKKIDDLSFGNRKKVGIIQALLHEPKLLILDEPTGGLDPLIQQTFFDILEEENKKGITIFFSSHILSEVQRMCEEVAIIKDGKIIAISNVNEMREDNYKKYNLVFNVETNDGIDKITGVTNYEKNGNRVDFLYKGDMNQVIKKLGEYDLKDISIVEPTLEEIFLHFYE